MSYSEKINQTVLDFFSKSTDTILGVRDFKISNYDQISQNEKKNIKQEIIQDIKPNQEKNQNNNDEITIFYSKDLEMLNYNYFGLKFQENKQKLNFQIVEKLLQKYPSWQMPCEKEIYIEIYTQINEKPEKIECWHLKFSHQNQSNSFKNSLNQSSNSQSFNNEIIIQNYSIIREPEKLNQTLTVLLRSIIMMLYNFPLHGFLYEKRQQMEYLKNKVQNLKDQLSKKKLNKDSCEQKTFMMKKLINYYKNLKSQINLHKKIHTDSQMLSKFNPSQKTKKIQHKINLLHHEFVFEIEYLMDLQELEKNDCVLNFNDLKKQILSLDQEYYQNNENQQQNYLQQQQNEQPEKLQTNNNYIQQDNSCQLQEQLQKRQSLQKEKSGSLMQNKSETDSQYSQEQKIEDEIDNEQKQNDLNNDNKFKENQDQMQIKKNPKIERMLDYDNDSSSDQKKISNQTKNDDEDYDEDEDDDEIKNFEEIQKQQEKYRKQQTQYQIEKKKFRKVSDNLSESQHKQRKDSYQQMVSLQNIKKEQNQLQNKKQSQQLIKNPIKVDSHHIHQENKNQLIQEQNKLTNIEDKQGQQQIKQQQIVNNKQNSTENDEACQKLNNHKNQKEQDYQINKIEEINQKFLNYFQKFNQIKYNLINLSNSEFNNYNKQDGILGIYNDLMKNQNDFNINQQQKQQLQK